MCTRQNVSGLYIFGWNAFWWIIFMVIFCWVKTLSALFETILSKTSLYLRPSAPNSEGKICVSVHLYPWAEAGIRESWPLLNRQKKKLTSPFVRTGMQDRLISINFISLTEHPPLCIPAIASKHYRGMKVTLAYHQHHTVPLQPARVTSWHASKAATNTTNICWPPEANHHHTTESPTT